VPSSEVDELRSVVRDYLSATSPSETVRKLMATDIGYDEASWRQMAGELGLQGIVVPERWGGAGAGVVELAVVFEEMGRALVCSPFFATVALATQAILASEDDAPQAFLEMGHQLDADQKRHKKLIAELEAKIAELRHASQGSAFNIEEEIGKLRDKLRVRTQEIFRDLSSWQVAQLARHPLRPYMLDYVGHICEEFEELAGDRAYADDAAMVCGIGRIDGRAVALMGHQKGRDTKSKIKRNFGMPRPEGYRKALRIMKLAERFKLPLLTFIDTPGA